MTNGNLIVVGVDGSPSSRQALTWAVQEAQLRSLIMLVVSCWQIPAPLSQPPWGTSPRTGAAQHTGFARARLARLVDEVVPEDSKVLIRQRVVQGRPGAELVALSEHAALLVVGAPGHGTVAGAVLGSVGQHVLAHSSCTVVVVR